MVDLAIFRKRNNLGDMPSITGIQKDDPTAIEVFGWPFACWSEDKSFCYLLGHFRLQKRQKPRRSEVLMIKLCV